MARYVTNDGESTQATILKHKVMTASGIYTYFVTYDVLDRPTLRVAHYHSGIVQSELGGRLEFTDLPTDHLPDGST